MVSSLEKRYLLSASLSPLRTHFIASLKTSGTTITYSGYCHPLPPDNSTTTQPKISTVCLPTSKKGKKFLQLFPLKMLNSRRTWGYLLYKKKRRKKKCPWSLAKIIQKRSSIKWPKNIFEVWVHFSLSPKHLWLHKIEIWSSTYLLRTTLRLGNTGDQGMPHSSYP